MSWQDLLASTEKPLKQQINGLRQQMAAAAQEIYDEWEQGDDGVDAEFGEGGICDAIQQAIMGVLSSSIDEVELQDGGQEGDDHAFVVAHNDYEAYGVDIPPSKYETGAGYTWRKIEGVQFAPRDIQVFEIPLDDLA